MAERRDGWPVVSVWLALLTASRVATAGQFYTRCDVKGGGVYNLTVPRLVDDRDKALNLHDDVSQLLGGRPALVVNVATF